MTELIIAEMLYLQYKDRTKPMYLYINSTGGPHAARSCGLHSTWICKAGAEPAELERERTTLNAGSTCRCPDKPAPAPRMTFTPRRPGRCRSPAGTTRADGETVGFETEGTAIYDTMCFVKNEASGLVFSLPVLPAAPRCRAPAGPALPCMLGSYRWRSQHQLLLN